jgi:peptide chain release factor subunit 3
VAVRLGRYDECVGKLTPFLKSSGYNVAKHVSWVPISALTGVNVLVRLGRPCVALQCPSREWWWLAVPHPFPHVSD